MCLTILLCQDLKSPEILLWWFWFWLRFFLFSEVEKATKLLTAGKIGIIGRASGSLHVWKILGIFYCFRVD